LHYHKKQKEYESSKASQFARMSETSAGNVEITRKPEFSDKCEICFACIHLCPQKAIHLPDEKSSARFLNPNIRLHEIMGSNNRHIALETHDKTI